MKAHEETWARDRKGDLRTPDGCFAVGLVDQASDADDGNMARLQLAACAPEMARMLLGVEWAANEDGYPACALGCGACEPGPHRDDCAWLALLRKAGVRE